MDRFTNFRRQEFTSNHARGPQYGIGYDPVVNHMLFQRDTGPLRRKRGGSGSGPHTMTRQEECFSSEESRRWMDAKQAAKVLQMKEEELATLTKEDLEDRWVKRYKECASPVHREEVLIATEVLLEYLDSTTFQKKNRLYYHDTLDNARIAIDMELEKARHERREKLMWFAGIASLGGGIVIFVVAYAKGVIKGADVREIGTNAGDYLTMSFLQPKNFEPAPDYNTRYFVTPSSLELDRKAKAEADLALRNLGASETEEEPPLVWSGGDAATTSAEAASLWDRSAEIQLRQEKIDQDMAEAHELLQMLNDSKEQVQGRAKSAENPGDTVAAGATSDKGETKDLRTFTSMLATNFGGGSRVQRMTAETAQRIAVKDEVRTRAEEGMKATGISPSPRLPSSGLPTDKVDSQ